MGKIYVCIYICVYIYIGYTEVIFQKFPGRPFASRFSLLFPSPFPPSSRLLSLMPPCYFRIHRTEGFEDSPLVKGGFVVRGIGLQPLWNKVNHDAVRTNLRHFVDLNQKGPLHLLRSFELGQYSRINDITMILILLQ